MALTNTQAKSVSKRQRRLAKADSEVVKSEEAWNQMKSDIAAAKKQPAKLEDSLGKAKEALRLKRNARNEEIWAV